MRPARMGPTRQPLVPATSDHPPPPQDAESSRTFTPPLAPSTALPHCPIPRLLKDLPVRRALRRNNPPPCIATATKRRTRELRAAPSRVSVHRRDKESGARQREAGDRRRGRREDVLPAAAQGPRVVRRRCGGGAGGAAAVPDDAGGPAPAVGLRPQGVQHPLHPDAAHRRRRRHRRLRPPRRALLRLHPRRLRPLHLPHHPPLHRAVPAVLLLPAPPGEPAAAGPLHHRHQLRRGAHLRLHQGRGDPGVGDPDVGGGGEPDGVHLLGRQARPRLQLPGPVPLRRRHDPHGVRAHPGLLPAGPRLPHGLRRPGGARLLRLHHLRHRQPHQAILLRRVRLGGRRALPRRRQPLPLAPHAIQGGGFVSTARLAATGRKSLECALLCLDLSLISA